MKDSIVKTKTFSFAVRIVKLSGYLKTEKREYIMARQILRSGTSVGAMVREAVYSESKPDFIHKLAIAQKEIHETIYWLELLQVTGYLKPSHFDSINADAVEIIKLLTSIIKTTKKGMKGNNH